ncbi:MAG: DUF3891 family protein [Limisphaerales bacterium]
MLRFIMLHRVHDEEGIVVISQPAHAWVAGQFARHWGNDTFGRFEPDADVYIAAALHDIGYLNWEQAPTLNPQTGLPYSFLELPTEARLALWRKSIQKMMRYGRYPALLVSLHFTHLCDRHRKFDSPQEFELEKKFLRDQGERQRALVTSLQNDFYYGAWASDENIERNARLVSVWDWISLSLCIGFEDERVIENVPCAGGRVNLTMSIRDEHVVRFDPWPFRSEEPLQIVCEGRHLLKTFTDEEKMREALRAASPVTLKFDLVPSFELAISAA